MTGDNVSILIHFYPAPFEDMYQFLRSYGTRAERLYTRISSSFDFVMLAIHRLLGSSFQIAERLIHKKI